MLSESSFARIKKRSLESSYSSDVWRLSRTLFTPFIFHKATISSSLFMCDSSSFCFECNEGMTHWQAILAMRERGANFFSHFKKYGVKFYACPPSTTSYSRHRMMPAYIPLGEKGITDVFPF